MPEVVVNVHVTDLRCDHVPEEQMNVYHFLSAIWNAVSLVRIVVLALALEAVCAGGHEIVRCHERRLEVGERVVLGVATIPLDHLQAISAGSQPISVKPAC